MIKKVKFLELMASVPREKFVVIGSGAMVALGLVKENADLDVVVHPDWLAMVPEEVDAGTDLLTLGMEFSDVLDESVEVEDIRVMSIQLLRKFYGKLNRQKDQEKILILQR